jgi:hypothetical protein
MARDQQPATVLLRMSPQLRAGLRDAAAKSGCSVNAFAVQVLATAVGDPARFRPPDVPVPDLHDIPRDGTGFPVGGNARREHLRARNEFIRVMSEEMPGEMVALVKKYDAEDPGHFVEWQRLREA